MNNVLLLTENYSELPMIFGTHSKTSFYTLIEADVKFYLYRKAEDVKTTINEIEKII